MTKHGDDLAFRLLPYIGMTPAIRETCARLANLGRRYDSIQVRWCNVAMDEETTAKWERREERLEAQITDLARDLPAVWPQNQEWKVEFEGDPRGPTVKLVNVTDDGHEIRVMVA